MANTHLVNEVAAANGKRLTEKQELALENVAANPLDVRQAFLDAGYDTKGVMAAIRALKEEIKEIAELQMVAHAPRAVHTITGIMTAEEAVPMATQKLNASTTVLDRVGLGKKDQLDVNHNVSGGLFILPAKKSSEEIIDGDFSEA